MNCFTRALAVVLCLTAWGASLSIRAATVDVSIIDFAFTPTPLTVQAGDTVRWTNTGFFPHSSTSLTALWDSGLMGHNGTFSFTFNSAGSFDYECSLHLFRGTIIVQAASNAPPAVAITTPTNGAVYTAPALLVISATATDTDGTVTSVAFFDDTNLLGAATTAPYNVTNSFGLGSHTLTAVATDNQGAATTSTPVTITLRGVDTVANSAITDSGYVPGTVTVVRGDFVRWTNTASGPHTSTSGTAPVPDGTWDTGTLNAGDVSSQQFNTVGSYPYFDALNPSNSAYAGLVRVIDATDILFRAISALPSGEMAFQWASADTRKYDVFAVDSLVHTAGIRLAAANLRASGTGTNLFTDPPFRSSPLFPPNTNLFYGLRFLPDNIPALPVRLDVVASNFTAPTALKEPADGSGRLFVTDQIGLIMIVDSNRNVLPTPFLDLTGPISNLAPIPIIAGITNVGLNPVYDERGLQGLAFDPGFTTNGRVFVYYNSPKTGANINCEGILAAYHVSATNANMADPNGTIIFRVDKPEFNHNGGGLTFGPDGYLYLPLGDGGGAGDQHGTIGNAQDTNSYLGKILRLDVSSGTNYAIPPDNPFVGSGGLGEIYAYGLRHPWRISFDRGASNRLVVADVGQDTWEEIEFVRKGDNCGWRIMEGNHAFDFPLAGTLGLDVRNLVYPIHEYKHGPLGIAAIGAAFYRGASYPELVGKYVFGDFSADFLVPDGHLCYLAETRPNIWERFAFVLAPSNAPLGRYVKSFGEDQAGNLYMLSTTNLGPSGLSGDIRLLSKP